MFRATKLDKSARIIASRLPVTADLLGSTERATTHFLNERFDKALFESEHTLLNARESGEKFEHMKTYPVPIMQDAYFAATERALDECNDDSFDEALFASDNIILCDSYLQLIGEKIDQKRR